MATRTPECPCGDPATCIGVGEIGIKTIAVFGCDSCCTHCPDRDSKMCTFIDGYCVPLHRADVLIQTLLDSM